METFETYENKQNIYVKSTYTSIAKRFETVSFSLRKENDLSDFILLDRIDGSKEKAKFNKNKAQERAILSITNQFFVDSDLIPQKEKIMKSTIVTHGIHDKDFRSTYLSTMADFEDEFFNEEGAKFSVVKRIKIVLNKNFRESHKLFIANQNS